MKSGELRTGLISSEIITINQQKSILSIIRDITERKKAEENLKESELMLKKQNDEYLALNNELTESNEQILKINEELTVEKDKAQESERLKTVFLHNMTHEIRTPMNAIIGFAELMTLDFDNKDKLLEYAEIINHRCEDLLEIINDILEISKIEAGQMPVHLEEIDINELLTGIYAIFDTHKKKNDKLHINFEVLPLESQYQSKIITDKVKLKQILTNLISNAFKFTMEGKISVSCELNSENIISFRISDTGIGIENDKIPLIFERFMQLDNSSTRPFGGTGLGLSIVKGLLNLLGGEISVTSEPLEGSTFQFSLPCKTSSATKEKSKQTEEFKQPMFKNKKVLIVEDDLYNAQYLKELLNNLEMELSVVQNGESAVNLVKSGNYFDIVLMDIRLLGMDGFVATKKLKNINPKIKIIAQTAYASQDDKLKALEAGCIDYITKPIKRQLLLSILSMHLK
jgi:signal transduction histidine kinase